MIKFENYEVVGWEHAIRGMRNPKNSWANSDSTFKEMATTVCLDENGNPKTMYVQYPALSIGPNDHELMTKLGNAGPVHGKYRRMIEVYVDITAPLYWWKEFDTYKVGTVANSCSTMHKIHAKEFTLEDFSYEHLVSGWTGNDKNGERIILPGPIECLENIVIMLNRVRNSYMVALKTESETGLRAKDIWWQMIQLLPSSYNQKRTVMLSYEVLANMYEYRYDHKLDEWREMCRWIECLPYSEIITGKEIEKCRS